MYLFLCLSEFIKKNVKTFFDKSKRLKEDLTPTIIDRYPGNNNVLNNDSRECFDCDVYAKIFYRFIVVKTVAV